MKMTSNGLAAFVMAIPMLLASHPAQATKILPLATGSAMPDIRLSNMVNSNTGFVRLADYRGKVIILDFWATWCGSCIHEFPRLDSLQKKLGNNLVIITVTDETPSAVKAFLKTHKRLGGIKLLFLTADTILKQYFPYRSIPHEVWIDPQGKVYAQTNAQKITEQNILACFAGKPYTGLQKLDVTNFDWNKPFYSSTDAAVRNALLWNCSLYKGFPGAGNTAGIEKTATGTRRYFLNYSLLNIYAEITGLPFINRRIVLEVKDSLAYIKPKEDDGDWFYHHSYCYEIISPPVTPDRTIVDNMLRDLNRYMGVNGRVEKRTTTCMALVRIAGRDSLLYSKRTNPQVMLPTDEADSLVLINQPISSLVNQLNISDEPDFEMPLFLDETGFTGNIDISLPANALSNVALLKKALSKYGILLKPVQRETDVFVLTENQ